MKHFQHPVLCTILTSLFIVDDTMHVSTARHQGVRQPYP